MPDVLDALDKALTNKQETSPEVANGGESNSPAARNHDEQDAEIDSMQRDVDLLSMIREDTGESGRESGNTVYFRKSCPICGHKDCFRFYPSTNTWACFGGSNPNMNANGRDGGAYIKYVLRTNKASNNTEAVRMLREATGNTYQPKAKQATTKAAAIASDDAKNEKSAIRKLFDSLNARLLHTDQLTGENRRPKPKYIIEGLVSEQSINMIAAPSKQCKSWAALSMCWAIANGTSWMGYFRCNKGTVLYVDIELGEDWLSQRLDDVRMAEKHESGYHVISLKGDVQTTLPILRQWLTCDHPRDFDVVCIDPLYLFEEGEENAAETWIPIMRELAAIQKGCLCAVIYVHHFSKAWYNQPPENRPAGSGVIGRFYEQAIVLSPRQLDDAGMAQLTEQYGDKARAYEFFTASRNYDEADIKSVIWCWPSFHADVAHEYDQYPITGSSAGNRILGSTQASERSERLRSMKDEATGKAIELCVEAGESPTRANVHSRLGPACKSLGIEVPTLDTFKSWTKKGGCTHYRVDQKRKNELHPVDLDLVDENGNAPFLPTPEQL